MQSPLARRARLGVGLGVLALVVLALSGLLPGSDWAAGSFRVGIAALIGAGVFWVGSRLVFRRAPTVPQRTRRLVIVGFVVLLLLGCTGLGLQGTLNQAQGNALLSQQKFAQALQEFQVVGDKESQAKVYLAWGKQLYKQQQYDQATQKFMQALQLKPSGDLTNQIQDAEERAFEDWGNQFYAQKDYENAINKLEQAAKIGVRTDQVNETLAQVHEDYGLQLLGLGQYAEAANNFIDATTLTQNTALAAQAKNNLLQTYDAWGKQLEQTGDFSGAADKFKSELIYATTPEQMRLAHEFIAKAYLLWGDQYLSNSNFQNAITTFEFILNNPHDYSATSVFSQLHGEDAKAYFGLGKQQETSGSCADARSTFDTLIKNFGDTPQAQQAAAELRKPQNVTGQIVVHGSSKPAAHVRLWLSARWDLSPLGFTATHSYTTVSDANGNFTFSGVPPSDTDYLISYIGQSGRESITVETLYGLDSPVDIVTVHSLCPTNAGMVEQF
jgi:tetratricopeptide (TPR) repeat protein